MSKYDKYIGELFDGVYKIEKIIGVGGMAVVFQAYNAVNDRVVAIKMLREEMNEKREYVQRFINESKTLSLLEHPNIVKVYLVNTKSTPKYMVMEKIDGVNLKKYMDKKTPGFAMTISVVKQTLAALEHANSKGVTHRDIKPHNIMLKKDGTVVLTDFGIATLKGIEDDDKDRAIGTALYISPEQAQGQKSDCRSDIYSLGMVMYEMITGKHPFSGDSAEAIATKQINEEPVAPHKHIQTIPTGLEQIILRAISKKPEDRFSTPTEMKKYLLKLEEDPFVEFSFRKKDSILTAAASTPKTIVKEKKISAKEDSFSITPSIFGLFASFVVVVLITAIYVLITIFPNSVLNIFNMKDVPDVVIQDYVYSVYNDQFYEQLVEEGYDVSVEYYVTSKYPTNTIISQSPVAGRSLKKTGLKINFTVSIRPEMQRLKNYTMMDYRDAKSELERLGYEVVVNKVEDPTIKIGKVISMSPASGTKVDYGTKVTLTVSDGYSFEYIKVTDYTNSPQIIAVADVQKFYTLKNVTYEYSDEIGEGRIISQSLEADSYVAKGSYISFTVSLGPKNSTSQDIPVDNLE
ncbi:MAG: protein kinase [Clostridia bacterium]|nr:protein kinase [Clostridia bacterium]